MLTRDKNPTCSAVFCLVRFQIGSDSKVLADCSVPHVIFNVRQSILHAHVIDIGWVRPSVRLSITRWYCVETAQPIVKLSSLPGSPITAAISGCRSLSQSFEGNFFELVMVGNPRWRLFTPKRNQCA